MIGADQMATASSAQTERATVLAALNRSEVANQLQALGLDPSVAKDRVGAMTDEEVRTLAGQMDSLPAGGISTGWEWALALIVVGAVIWLVWKR